MKFSVGYQMMPTDTFIDTIIENKEHIHEVYFSWGNYKNGRNSQLRQSGLTPWEAQERQIADLARISEAGIDLNLLFNAMCYGRDSQSRAFFEGIGDTVDYLVSHYSLKSVTTTSPLIAKFLRSNFKNLDIRASVNMGIGTVEGFDYIKQYYDSFYLARELNRDFNAIARIKAWCTENGKTLYALANSGCLNNCSAHTFHDNLVAHESEIAEMDNGFAFRGLCAEYLSDRKNINALFDNTSYIRPEDIHLYEGIFPAMKLATRVNPDPVRVLKSYINGRHHGSTTSLLEPDHTAHLYPYLLENSRITAKLKDNKLVYSDIENSLVKLED